MCVRACEGGGGGQPRAPCTLIDYKKGSDAGRTYFSYLIGNVLMESASF